MSQLSTRIFTPEEICKFWFGDVKSDTSEISWKKRSLWYEAGKQFDKLIDTTYGTLMTDLLDKNKYKHWLKTPIGNVATIIVGDQFTRNVYRNTQKAFSYDTKMQQIVCNGIKNGMDNKILGLHPEYLNFYYHPLMHSERKEIQKLSKIKYQSLFKTLKLSYHPINVSYMRPWVDEHKLIVDTFGRYIYRDKIRNIKLSKEEYKKLLKLPKSCLNDYIKSGGILPQN